MANVYLIPAGISRRTFLLSVAALAGCGGGGSGPSSVTPAATQSTPAAPAPIPSDPLLQRRGILVQDGRETATVVWNGEVIAISFLRDWAPLSQPIGTTGIEVRRWSDGTLLASHPWPGCMGCAIVHNGAIHIFGATEYTNGLNKMVHSTLDPVTFAPSTAVDLALGTPPSPFRFFNAAVTQDPRGFRMVLETSTGVFFARSPDLNAWDWTPGQLNPGVYTGCPSIHYLNGAHYLTYLRDTGTSWETVAVKSTDDCLTFTFGKALLIPDAADGTNASDVDMVEFNGKVCGVYLDGDQQTYAHLRRFEYAATLSEMFAKYA